MEEIQSDANHDASNNEAVFPSPKSPTPSSVDLYDSYPTDDHFVQSLLHDLNVAFASPANVDHVFEECASGGDGHRRVCEEDSGRTVSALGTSQDRFVPRHSVADQPDLGAADRQAVAGDFLSSVQLHHLHPLLRRDSGDDEATRQHGGHAVVPSRRNGAVRERRTREVDEECGGMAVRGNRRAVGVVR